MKATSCKSNLSGLRRVVLAIAIAIASLCLAIFARSAGPAKASPVAAGYPDVTYMQDTETYTTPQKPIFIAYIDGAQKAYWTAKGFKVVKMHTGHVPTTMNAPRGESQWSSTSGQPNIDKYFVHGNVTVELRAYNGSRETVMFFYGHCTLVKCTATEKGPYHHG